MTSVKSFINWIREAGRGHLTAFVSWGVFSGYAILTAFQISLGINDTCFGIGNWTLLWICSGLGLMSAMAEFFYLFQQKKQDFYYSLPVRREVIFWSRYVHGLLHFLAPFLLTMAGCGALAGMTDAEFAGLIGSYTAKSMLVFLAIFLIFYHIGIVCAVLCGHPAAAVCGWGVVLFYFQVLTGNVFPGLAGNHFTTYYRIELLEKLNDMLSPTALAEKLAGTEIYIKYEILRYQPKGIFVTAAAVWIAGVLAAAFLAFCKRKTEHTGRVFTINAAERGCQFMLAFLAGVWISYVLIDLYKIGTNRPAAAMVYLAAGTAAALGVTFILAWIFRSMGGKTGVTKGQAAVSVGAVFLTGGVFLAAAPAYDNWFPDATQAVGICVSGIGMNAEESIQTETGRYETDEQLEKYVLTGEGHEETINWAKELMKSENETAVTHAVISYILPDGSRHYRVYPVSREQIKAFAAVYETEEYKKIAYPGMESACGGQERFEWYDGVKSRGMKLSDEEKKELLEVWKADVSELEMNDLTFAAPYGEVKVKSSEGPETTVLPVYPFFERTCKLLDAYGIDTEAGISQYTVESVEVRENAPVSVGVSGGVHMSFYETPEEISPWLERLVPAELDLQPLLYPLDHSKEIKALVIDEETNSLLGVECVLCLE